jgi:hypothetical protein
LESRVSKDELNCRLSIGAQRLGENLDAAIRNEQVVAELEKSSLNIVNICVNSNGVLDESIRVGGHLPRAIDTDSFPVETFLSASRQGIRRGRHKIALLECLIESRRTRDVSQQNRILRTDIVKRNAESDIRKSERLASSSRGSVIETVITDSTKLRICVELDFQTTSSDVAVVLRGFSVSGNEAELPLVGVDRRRSCARDGDIFDVTAVAARPSGSGVGEGAVGEICGSRWAADVVNVNGVCGRSEGSHVGAQSREDSVMRLNDRGINTESATENNSSFVAKIVIADATPRAIRSWLHFNATESPNTRSGNSVCHADSPTRKCWDSWCRRIVVSDVPNADCAESVFGPDELVQKTSGTETIDKRLAVEEEE